MRKAVIPVLAGLIGGAVAIAVALVVGLGGTEHVTTTVVQQAPLSAQGAREADGGQQLTARDIYKRDAPGVVFVRAQVVAQSQSPFGFGQQQQGEATGSGFVIDDNGDILTNAHVVDGAVKITVQFDNDKTVDARVVGKDIDNDLALLRVDPDGLDLQPLALGTAKSVQVGDPVLAIGNPYGLDRTLTTGVISAKQREIQAPNGFTIRNVLQTDAAINPGNSGGPLFDMAGNVVGVNTAILSQSGTGSGVGFAIPSNTVRRIVPYLIEFGSYEHSWLGISGMTVQPAQREAMNLDSAFKGVMVTLVSPNSPAERGGLRGTDRAINTPLGQIPVNGDIITAIDGQPIEDMNDLIMYLEDGTLPGDTVSLSVWRDGQQREVQVQLGARPS